MAHHQYKANQLQHQVRGVTGGCVMGVAGGCVMGVAGGFGLYYDPVNGVLYY